MLTAKSFEELQIYEKVCMKHQSTEAKVIVRQARFDALHINILSSAIAILKRHLSKFLISSFFAFCRSLLARDKLTFSLQLVRKCSLLLVQRRVFRSYGMNCLLYKNVCFSTREVT